MPDMNEAEAPSAPTKQTGGQYFFTNDRITLSYRFPRCRCKALLDIDVRQLVRALAAISEAIFSESTFFPSASPTAFTVATESAGVASLRHHRLCVVFLGNNGRRIRYPCPAGCIMRRRSCRTITRNGKTFSALLRRRRITGGVMFLAAIASGPPESLCTNSQREDKPQAKDHGNEVNAIGLFAEPAKRLPRARPGIRSVGNTGILR